MGTITSTGSIQLDYGRTPGCIKTWLGGPVEDHGIDDLGDREIRPLTNSNDIGKGSGYVKSDCIESLIPGCGCLFQGSSKRTLSCSPGLASSIARIEVGVVARRIHNQGTASVLLSQDSNLCLPAGVGCLENGTHRPDTQQ